MSPPRAGNAKTAIVAQTRNGFFRVFCAPGIGEPPRIGPHRHQPPETSMSTSSVPKFAEPTRQADRERSSVFSVRFLPTEVLLHLLKPPSAVSKGFRRCHRHEFPRHCVVLSIFTVHHCFSTLATALRRVSVRGASGLQQSVAPLQRGAPRSSSNSEIEVTSRNG